MDLDVAVVGGGVSGAYSAWRLQQALGAERESACSNTATASAAGCIR